MASTAVPMRTWIPAMRPPEPRRDWPMLAVFAVSVALYANTLNAGFVYDDSRAVQRNPDAAGDSPWTAAFANDFWGTPLEHSGSHGSYRPLAVLSLRLNAFIDATLGGGPLGFHLVNVLLHSLCSLLVLGLCRRLLRSDFVATVAALLFAAHPVHCEAVASVVGRADLLCALFYLRGLQYYVAYVQLRETLVCMHDETPRSRGHGRRSSKDLLNQILDHLLNCTPSAKVGNSPSYTVPCSRCMRWYTSQFLTAHLYAVFATLSKEPGITLIAAFFTYELIIQLRHYRSRDQVTQPLQLLVLVASGAALLTGRLALAGFRVPRFAAADNPSSHEASALTRALTFLYLPAVNMRLLLWPQQLSFDWSMDAVPRVVSLADPRNAMSAVLYYSLWRCGRCALRALYRPRPAAKSGRARDDNNNGSSGYAYMPYEWEGLAPPETVLIALALLVAPALPATNLFFYVGFVVAERVLYLPSVGFCLLVALGAHRLHQVALRYLQTRNGTGLTVVVAFALALAALGARTVTRNADWHDELALYRSGIEVNPAKAYGNLGTVLSGLNKLEEAEFAYRMALRHRPNMADVHYNLGNLLASNRKYEEAVSSYQKAIHFRPTLALAYVNLGHVLALQGRVQDAINVFREGGSLPSAGLRDPAAHDSARASALLHLAHIEASTGNLPEAKRHLDEALRIKPPNYEVKPILKLLAEVKDSLKLRNGTNKAVKKVFLRKSTGMAKTFLQSDCKAANDSRCSTADYKS